MKAIEEHPGTGQTGRLVRFLAGVYNGGNFPFDLTDLRALDAELANACIDYLNYDQLGKVEVHTHLPDGGRQMQWFMRNMEFGRGCIGRAITSTRGVCSGGAAFRFLARDVSRVQIARA